MCLDNHKPIPDPLGFLLTASSKIESLNSSEISGPLFEIFIFILFFSLQHEIKISFFQHNDYLTLQMHSK